MMTEEVTIDKTIHFCDCVHTCLESIKLPDDEADMLLNDTALILIIGKHKPPGDPQGGLPGACDYERVETKGKGYKIYKRLAVRLGDKAVK